MNNYQFINKKLVIVVFLTLCLLVILGFLSMYSLVTINGIGNDNKSIYIHWGNEDNQRKILNLTNNSKTFFLRKQSVTIEVTSGDKKSVYKKDIGGFPKQEISVETSPKKRSLALGVSFFKCATSDSSNERITYYPCAPASGSSIDTKTTREKTSVVFSNLIPQEDYGSEFTELDINSIVLPYRNGFIEAAVVTGNLYIGEYTLAGEPVGNPIRISDFNATIDEKTVSVVNDEKSSNLSILNTDTNSLYLFDNPQDSDPDIVKLSDELEKTNDAQLKTILTSPEAVYLVVYRDPSLLETHDHDGVEDRELDKEVSTANKEQVVIKVNTSKKSINTQKLPDDLLIREMAINPLGEIVFLPHYSATKQQIYVLRNGSMQHIPFVINDVSKLCWTSSNELFYSSGDSIDIYRYSFDKLGSFLVYSNPNASIIDMRCNFGKLTFSLEEENDGLLNEFSHFLLTNDTSVGKPLEEVLPMYVDLPNNTGVVSVTQNGKSANINLVYSSGTIPSKESILKLVKDRLEVYQVDTKNLQIDFTF